MATPRSTVSSFKHRQATRTMQRGSLRNSTLIALAVVAVCGLIASQAHRLSEIGSTIGDGFISWSSAHGFSIENVEVVGRKKVSSAFIMGALQIKRGMPIFAYDPRAAQARLSENPWFKTINVERRLPNTIFLRLEERVPMARWQVDGKLALIDAEGVALTTEFDQAYNALPIIIGQNARHKMINLINLVGSYPEIAKQLAAATWMGDRRWDLKLKNNMIIRLPAESPELALAHLMEMDNSDQLLERDLISIDLRLPEQAIITPTVRSNTLIERPNFNETPDRSKTNI
jgi:cell division protein FtsQ